MRKLSLADYAQIAEIVAAIAVVVSLIYVGKGLSDNTAAIRAASVQTITEGTRESLLAIALDEQLAQIVQVGSDDVMALNEQERYRFSLFSRQRWLFFQSIWTQYRLGVLRPEVHAAYERIICSMMAQQGNRDELSRHADVLDVDFVAAVRAC